MLAVPIAHLAEVGRAAAREEHELGKTFRFKPGASTYLAFRTAARGMASSAETHREVLAKYGLAQSVLDQFVQMLDQFDAAVALGIEGRTAHVGATRELQAVASEIFRTVRLMNGRNRQRFADDGQLLGILDQRQYGAGYSTAWYGVGRRDTGRRGGEARSVRRAWSVRSVP